MFVSLWKLQENLYSKLSGENAYTDPRGGRVIPTCLPTNKFSFSKREDLSVGDSQKVQVQDNKVS